MIDQKARVTALVKEELRGAAAGEQVGYAVTQSFAPMQSPDGQVGLMFCWIVTVTMRNPLLKTDDFAFIVIIPAQANVPDDKAFRESAMMALGKVREMRDEALGGGGAKLTIPGELVLAA